MSNALYVYLRDPDGHQLKVYTSDYYTGDPDHPVQRWSVLDPRRRDFWGNAVIPSWYTDASSVLDLDGKLRPVTEIKQQADAVHLLVDGRSGGGRRLLLKGLLFDYCAQGRPRARAGRHRPTSGSR